MTKRKAPQPTFPVGSLVQSAPDGTDAPIGTWKAIVVAAWPHVADKPGSADGWVYITVGKWDHARKSDRPTERQLWSEHLIVRTPEPLDRRRSPFQVGDKVEDSKGQRSYVIHLNQRGKVEVVFESPAWTAASNAYRHVKYTSEAPKLKRLKTGFAKVAATSCRQAETAAAAMVKVREEIAAREATPTPVVLHLDPVDPLVEEPAPEVTEGTEDPPAPEECEEDKRDATLRDQASIRFENWLAENPPVEPSCRCKVGRSKEHNRECKWAEAADAMGLQIYEETFPEAGANYGPADAPADPLPLTLPATDGEAAKVQPCPCGDASGLAQIHPNGSVYCVECGADIKAPESTTAADDPLHPLPAGIIPSAREIGRILTEVFGIEVVRTAEVEDVQDGEVVISDRIGVQVGDCLASVEIWNEEGTEVLHRDPSKSIDALAFEIKSAQFLQGTAPSMQPRWSDGSGARLGDPVGYGPKGERVADPVSVLREGLATRFGIESEEILDAETKVPIGLRIQPESERAEILNGIRIYVAPLGTHVEVEEPEGGERVFPIRPRADLHAIRNDIREAHATALGVKPPGPTLDLSTPPKMLLDPEALYFTDNGRVLHGRCCGSSAKFSGRDLSGQKVHKATAADHADAKATDWTISCEDCDSAARRSKAKSGAASD